LRHNKKSTNGLRAQTSLDFDGTHLAPWKVMGRVLSGNAAAGTRFSIAGCHLNIVSISFLSQKTMK
jgi:hypothetical protein